MKVISSIFFCMLVFEVIAAPYDTSDPSSLYLSKLRSSNLHTKQIPSIENALSKSSRRRAGRPGRRPSSGFASGGTSSDEDGSAECFPGNSRVTVLGRGFIKMSELEIGDRVLTKQGYSPVYMFSHRITEGTYHFVKLVTDSKELIVSTGHYIYALNRLVTAGSLQVGDKIEEEDGKVSHILRKETVQEVGLYNPHTIAGEMVVNGVRVSVYTKNVDPTFANSLLSPIRAAFQAFSVDMTGGLFASDVSESIVQALPQGHSCITAGSLKQ